jgi:hypothetical protein
VGGHSVDEAGVGEFFGVSIDNVSDSDSLCAVEVVDKEGNMQEACIRGLFHCRGALGKGEGVAEDNVHTGGGFLDLALWGYTSDVEGKDFILIICRGQE